MLEEFFCYDANNNRIQYTLLMQSPFQFITRPVGGTRYNNTKEIGGISFIVSTSEEDFRFSNREAEVLSVPRGYSGPIKPGHKLLVHHNVFKFYNDMRGQRKSGKSFFKDDIFLIDEEQFFMYHDGERWNAHDRYCFVSPIPAIQGYIFKPMTHEPLMGVMEYPNERLVSLGIGAGDKVVFKPDSEYEFKVDGKKMYRMFDHQIVLKL